MQPQLKRFNWQRKQELIELNCVKIYPKDELGWRWIPIEIRDANFMNIGDKTNELLLKQARQRVSGPVEGN